MVRIPKSARSITSFCLLASFGATGCASSGHDTSELGPPPVSLADLDAPPARIASRLRVVGRVLDEAGEPVPEALVIVQAFVPRSRCVGGRGAWGQTRARTDGWFLQTLYFYSLRESDSCVRVIGRPGRGLGLAHDTVVAHARFRTRGRMDTLLVALVLQPKASP